MTASPAASASKARTESQRIEAAMSPLARRAAALFAVDPLGLGGLRLRAAAGPVRDAWLAALRARLPSAMPWQRLPLSISDDRLLGGLDLAASLNARRSVLQRGLLSQCDGGVLVAPMAERLPARVVSALTAVLDQRELVVEREGFAERQPAHLAVLALDEALPDDDALAPALADRLALDVTLLDAPGSPAASGSTDLPGSPAPQATELPGGGSAATRAQGPAGSAGSPAEGAAAAWPDVAVLDRARALLPAVHLPDELLETLCRAALALGIESARAPWWAVRVARAEAALNGRTRVTEDDARLAAALVLAPRATRLPADGAPEEAAEPPESSAEPPEPPPPEAPDDDPADADNTPTPPPDLEAMSERLVEAALAALPAGLLARLAAAAQAPRGRTDSEGRSGVLTLSRRRGAPLGVRPGDPRRGERLSLVDTLRAAIPWQRLRGGRADEGVALRMDDLRVVRRAQHRRSTTVFLIDASGSAALHRLAEAKGAVELLLAECYVRRDRVALVAFRGRPGAAGAELLLPPTRSLVRAKRSLEALPGGGGTPLASGLDAARTLAEDVARRGGTPVVVVLSDGRANLARDGSPGRAAAHADALASARAWLALDLQVLWLDTAPQPQDTAREVALAMGARYLPLPHADARQVSRLVSRVTSG